MPDETRHESADLEDIETRDASETLVGNIGDDPLDTGVAAPERWSAAMRFGTTAAEQEEGESLDQQLDEEEPDVFAELDREQAQDGEDEDEDDADYAKDADFTPTGDDDEEDDDEDVADQDLDGLLLDDGPDPRAGRLVAPDEGAHADGEADLVATDVGIDGGGASAEEAALHVVEDDDTDIRSGD
jgi:Family of unknown function (DUF5709)